MNKNGKILCGMTDISSKCTKLLFFDFPKKERKTP